VATGSDRALWEWPVGLQKALGQDSLRIFERVD
jgi:hypothetical protein